jgi:hypothetical protein
MKERDPKRTPKTLIPLAGNRYLMEAKTLKAISKETKQHICRVGLQGLPNLTRKKNGEKFERQLK